MIVFACARRFGRQYKPLGSIPSGPTVPPRNRIEKLSNSSRDFEKHPALAAAYSKHNRTAQHRSRCQLSDRAENKR